MTSRDVFANSLSSRIDNQWRSIQCIGVKAMVLQLLLSKLSRLKTNWTVNFISNLIFKKTRYSALEPQDRNISPNVYCFQVYVGGVRSPRQPLSLICSVRFTRHSLKQFFDCPIEAVTWIKSSNIDFFKKSVYIVNKIFSWWKSRKDFERKSSP